MKIKDYIEWSLIILVCIITFFAKGYILNIFMKLTGFIGVFYSIYIGIGNIKQNKKYSGYIQILIGLIVLLMLIMHKIRHS
ncbi:hypothetical protein [Clostridium botulinum]|uniref:hypothetical protein n=1 Tax=Clostridium botulinum TaxID=1491 RepID=UPI0004D66710|nr:hypothetical protein [Clostridium botulinum]KEI04339.1 hypothetical protein Z952_07200 [Clostridium botulinum C/D str. BKT75002]KEI09333.1 hypothetical protein Z954_13200 [Clostridium botulinum C/D str. BKT2873]